MICLTRCSVTHGDDGLEIRPDGGKEGGAGTMFSRPKTVEWVLD